jgi:YkoY family integral membrane protein
MFGQLFELQDIPRIGVLVGLEALLSADNALILAIMVRHLPKDQQKRALFYGLAGAVVLRFAAIALAAQILSFWWLQVVGALYLLFLPIKHFVSHGVGSGSKGAAGASFWMTVLYADLADLAFAIDSVLVAVAVVNQQNKIWIVIAGAAIGIVLLRYAANWCLKIMERYPIFDHVAYLLVGWAGIKLLFVGGHTFASWFEKANPGQSAPIHVPEMSPLLFWTGLLLIAGLGSWIALRKPADIESEALTEEIELTEVTPTGTIPLPTSQDSELDR